MSAVIEEARSKLKEHLSELDAERQRVERAISALSNGTAKPRRGRVSRVGRKATTAAPSRRKRSGTRADEAVKLVEKHPKGITAAQIAKTMKIKPNYLYRVLGDMEKEGKVRKDKRTYFPPTVPVS